MQRACHKRVKLPEIIITGMSRKGKTGLDYFPFDVDFFTDEKIEFVSAKYEEKGELISIKLLCKIYRNGYFIKWGEDESLLFSKRAGDNINQVDVDNVITELLKRDFFNNKLYKKYKILTSRGIQQRFFKATERRKKVNVTKEYLLTDISDYNVDILPLNDNISTQSKVKESKVKESKVNNIESEFPNLNLKAWNDWLNYKKDIKDKYKTERGEKAKITELINMSNGDSDLQDKLINQAIDCEWKGIHPLKNGGQNGSNSRGSKTTPQRSEERAHEILVGLSESQGDEGGIN